MAPRLPAPRLIDRALGRVASGYIRLVERTSEPPPLMERYIDDLLAMQPVILAMWHGQFIMLPSLARLGVRTKAMLALHRDAEGLAQALDSFGIELIRGAGAGAKGKDRGGANAFRGAVTALEEGFSVAMTADVPPGPARRAGHGIVTLARVTGRPILPVAMASSRFLPLNTWSRMTLNLPFSRLGASFGSPIHVPKDASTEELERLRTEVETQLNIATVDAYARAGISHLRATPAAALSASGERAPVGRKLRAYRTGTAAFSHVAPAFLKYRERKGKEQPDRRDERLGIASLPRPDGPLVWLHAASVGETNAIVPLIHELKKARPDCAVLLTTGTVTSAHLTASRLSGIALHQFVPLDVPEYVARFVDHWRPDVALFVESEIWPNLILASAARNVPLVLVNARMSKTSYRRWRRHIHVARALFSRFAAILAQDRQFAERFIQLGAPRVTAVGNLKSDSPPLPVDAALRDEFRARFGNRPVLLAASTHDAEEIIIADAHRLLRATHPGLVTIIVPRHPARGPAIAETLAGRGFRVTRRAVGDMPDLGDTTPTGGIYLADTLGELGTFFEVAPVAFMGKSLSSEPGGHNPIECVRGGAAVLTGPGWHNFTESFTALIKAKGAIEVRSADEIAAATRRLIDDANERARMHANATRALATLTGALPATVETVLGILHKSAPGRLNGA